jgi:predicted amidohydrolase YtcJ
MGEARLWTGGRIFTGHRYAESLLVDDAEVVAVGADPDVRRLAPTGTNVVELRGRLVLPGLIDAHLHLGELARSRAGLDLASARDLDDLVTRIQEWAGAHPTGTVVGRGLDIDRSLGGRWPLRDDLDRAVSDRPLVVYHASGHAAIANTVALTEAQVESRAVEALRDRVGRAPDGRPNGVVLEEAVRWLAPLAATPVGPDDGVRTLEHLASLGLTTVASMNVSIDELTALRSLASDQRLPLRVRVYVRLLRLREYAPSDLAPVGAPGRFAVVGAKGFTDGAFGPRTAWLSEPYADAPDQSGIPVESDESLSEALAEAEALGLAPALHAIGDRAVVRATRLIAPYMGRRGAPPRIEHLGLVPPPVLSVLEEVRPALVVQPGFVWSDFWLPERLGPERVRWAYPFRTLADRGHRLVGSSDAPYDPVDPWRGLRASVERRDSQGRSANPNAREALAVEEAVGMYTVHGGGALGEPALGSLEVGSRADLVIVEATGLGAALRAGAAAVRETWVDGRRVYDVRGARPGQ